MLKMSCISTVFPYRARHAGLDERQVDSHELHHLKLLILCNLGAIEGDVLFTPFPGPW